MFYKHWKKIALSLTSFFWTSCDTDSASANSEVEVPASSAEAASSSSAPAKQVPGSSDASALVSSSSNETKSSSSEEPKSSSGNDFNVVPLYGVNDKFITCIDDSTQKVCCTVTTQENWQPEYECSNDICPDYGVVLISEKTYDCDDGNTYNEAEFIARYKTDDSKKDSSEVVLPQDTTFTAPVALYGPPCMFNNSCDEES